SGEGRGQRGSLWRALQTRSSGGMEERTSLVEEGSVTLRCELSKAGVPVEWRKEAQLLQEGEKYQMRQEGRAAEMSIRGVTLADGGEYSCSVGTAVTAAEIKVVVQGTFTSSATTLRTYLLKVGEPGPLKVNILPTGWKRCTRMYFQLCSRKEGAHAIVHLTSPPIKPLHHIRRHLFTTTCTKPHQFPC
uniref:Ig-like domain-containing protein n=1 Tax=Takifugu rubripes TaxID=31033 RepID=A0A674N5Q7_TAKRU